MSYQEQIDAKLAEADLALIEASLPILTERERKEFSSYTVGSIVGVKRIRSMNTDALKAALTDKTQGEALRQQVGADTNPSWVVGTIAETLYMRHAIDEIKLDYIMEYGELGKVEIL
jgi:hypothetical protein